MARAPICREHRPAAAPWRRRAARRTGRARSRRARPFPSRYSGSRQTECRASASRSRSLRRLGDRQNQQAADQHEQRGDGVGYFRRQPVQQAARHRADDGGGLPGRGIPGDRIGEILGRHQIGDQRARGRAEEGAGDAEQAEHQEDRAGPLNPRMVSSRIASAQNASRNDGQRHDQPAAEAVGGGTRHQHQQQRRQELDDADEAEIERIAGEVVDLPADGDRDDLGRKGREKPRRPEAHESAMAEGSVALVDGVSGHGRIPRGPSG